jgi:hypothetical protein
MCIFKKIKDIVAYGLDYTDSNCINSDYYNGSENDLENIFLELIALSEKPINVFNRDTYSSRIKFLANEGLHILDIKNIDAGSFKYSDEELNNVIFKAVPKKKISKKQVNKNIKAAIDDYKRTVTSSVNLPKLKTKKKK